MCCGCVAWRRASVPIHPGGAVFDRTGEQIQDNPAERRLVEMLRDAGDTCDLITIPDGRHGMGNWDAAHPEYKPQMIDWLRKTLKVKNAK